MGGAHGDEALIDAIYASVTSDDAISDVLERLARRFGCASAGFFYSDGRRPTAEISRGYGLLDAAAQARYAQYAHEDPAPAAMARLAVGEAVATNQLFDAAERARSRFLKEYYYPLGLRETLAGPIAADEGRAGVIAVHRGPDRKPFTKAEVAAFGRLTGHLARAMSLRRRFFELETSSHMLGEAVGLIGTSIFIVDQKLLIAYANRAARAVLAREDGLQIDAAGRLHAGDAAAETMLQALGGRSRDEPCFMLIPRVSGDRPYVLKASASTSFPNLLTLAVFDPVEEVVYREKLREDARRSCCPIVSPIYSA